MWGGGVPGGGFTDLPARPRVSRNTVALAAVALEGRLLALKLLGPADKVPVAPDQTLAEATSYSREYVRKALGRTLKAIGLTSSGPAQYPQRSVPAGDTAAERARHAKRQAETAKRRAARARAKSG
jgi:hypothetical protein